MGTRLLLGTDAGVVQAVRSKDDWSIESLGPAGLRIGPLAAGPDGTIFAGAGRRGLYRRDERGAWERALDKEVWSVAVAADGAVYAGTSPAAIYKSTDGGGTWQELQAIQRLPSRPKWTFPPPPHIPHVRTIVLDPGDPRKVWAGVEEGGVIFSGDGGASWEERNQGIYDDLHTLRVHSKATSVLYATTGAGFYRTGSAGRAWQERMGGLTNSYTVPIAVAPAEPDTLLVAAAAGPPPSWSGPRGAACRIFRSRDRGEHWQRLLGGLPEASAEMVMGMAFDPGETRAVYAGLGSALLVSPDAGDTWRQVLTTPGAIQSIVALA